MKVTLEFYSNEDNYLTDADYNKNDEPCGESRSDVQLDEGNKGRKCLKEIGDMG